MIRVTGGKFAMHDPIGGLPLNNSGGKLEVVRPGVDRSRIYGNS